CREQEQYVPILQVFLVFLVSAWSQLKLIKMFRRLNNDFVCVKAFKFHLCYLASFTYYLNKH
ncbi:hypothetical protein, partial [Lacticaseibacillus paracasei]|uniref:hypothetical protein n=1 Tax=Lacticaseibacillus paracasei TaxID=1597 RepID=UPI001CDBF93C